VRNLACADRSGVRRRATCPWTLLTQSGDRLNLPYPRNMGGWHHPLTVIEISFSVVVQSSNDRLVTCDGNPVTQAKCCRMDAVHTNEGQRCLNQGNEESGFHSSP
jgi:hypothetical protein